MFYSPHPLLRKRETGTAIVSYSELLSDLTYVFSVMQLSHYLLHNLIREGSLKEIVLWFAVRMLWRHTIWVTNWSNLDTRPIRILPFISMLVGLVMAVAIPCAFTYWGSILAVCYVLIQAGRTPYIIGVLGDHHLAANFKRIMGWFCISAVFWTTGAILQGEWQILLWIIATICDYTAPMHGFALPRLGRSDSSKEWTIEGHHLVERCQLFVITAFGETLLMTGAFLSGVEEWTPLVIIPAVIPFIGSLAMWWVYFDVSGEVGSRKIQEVKDPGKLGLIYNAIHIVLVGTLIICAIGDELIAVHPKQEMRAEVVFVLIIEPIVYILANNIYKYVTCRMLPLSHIIAVIASTLLLPRSYHISLLTMNTLVTSVFTLAIVFDMLSPNKGFKIKREPRIQRWRPIRNG